MDQETAEQLAAQIAVDDQYMRTEVMACVRCTSLLTGGVWYVCTPEEWERLVLSQPDYVEKLMRDRGE